MSLPMSSEILCAIWAAARFFGFLPPLLLLLPPEAGKEPAKRQRGTTGAVWNNHLTIIQPLPSNRHHQLPTFQLAPRLSASSFRFSSSNLRRRSWSRERGATVGPLVVKICLGMVNRGKISTNNEETTWEYNGQHHGWMMISTIFARLMTRTW